MPSLSLGQNTRHRICEILKIVCVWVITLGALCTCGKSYHSYQSVCLAFRSPRPPAAPRDEAEDVRQKVQAFEQEAEQKKQQAEKEVDDMLADLKKRLKER